MPEENCRVLAAEWVLPVSSEPIRDGALAIADRRIAWVGPRREIPSRFLRCPLRAFPRSLLLPGWVNAHSHLNLTAALGMIPGQADRFADWIRGVIRLQLQWPPALTRQAIVAGLDLLATTGTTTVAQVSTFPPVEPFLEHPMRSVLFHEPIGFAASRASELLQGAEEWLDSAAAVIQDAGVEHVRLGIAPHAPYTASPHLFRGLAALAERRSLPLSVHLSETVAEQEFVRSGSGQLRELLEDRNAWDDSWTPPGVSPVRYLADLGVLERPGVAAHCNYLSPEDARLLASGRLIPTWCPGSHRFFGHRDYPARLLLEAGAEIALGTDSLASNAGLNMLREVRLAAEGAPEVDRAVWLRAGTLTAAEALGLGDLVGSLETGKAADLQILDGVSPETTNPLVPLFEENLRVRAVLVDGVERKIR